MLANNWITALREICKDTDIIICANKADIDDRMISTKSGEMLEYWFQGKYFETSALNGQSINDMFNTITAMILKRT